jgi:N-acetyl-gamma-glutamyl-phosphate reductase
VILCLPDEAAREAVALIDNPETRVIDASTAHRVAQGWTYGFAELEPDGYQQIAAARRVSNPGCWATGFLAIMRPLVRAGLVPAGFPVTANGVSGYSGGGKSMIAEFRDKASADYTETVSRLYGLNLSHKHIPEMQKHTGLSHPPLFEPSVGRFYRGMLVEVPMQLWALPGTPSPRDVHAALLKAYPDRPLVKVASLEDAAAVKTLDAEILAGSNSLTLYVFANEKAAQVRVVAALDNLGKGAGGAAVQNLNIMLGFPETTGL